MEPAAAQTGEDVGRPYPNRDAAETSVAAKRGKVAIAGVAQVLFDALEPLDAGFEECEDVVVVDFDAGVGVDDIAVDVIDETQSNVEVEPSGEYQKYQGAHKEAHTECLYPRVGSWGQYPCHGNFGACWA